MKVFKDFLKVSILGQQRMSLGREFQSFGPTTEKAASVLISFVFGIVKSLWLRDVDLRTRLGVYRETRSFI